MSILVSTSQYIICLLLHKTYSLRTLVFIKTILILFAGTLKSMFAFTPYQYPKFFNHEVFLWSGLRLLEIVPCMIFCNILYLTCSKYSNFLFLMLFIISVVLLSRSNITAFRILSIQQTSIVPHFKNLG